MTGFFWASTERIFPSAVACSDCHTTVVLSFLTSVILLFISTLSAILLLSFLASATLNSLSQAVRSD
jgi:hypothetical protein